MAIKSYRNARTGKVHAYPEHVARTRPHLIEVPEGTKPLAFVPISEPAIDGLRARQTAGSDDETTIVTEASDLDPAPLPAINDTSERV
jgi:hypothetical protein